jgi:hypothetical protein
LTPHGATPGVHPAEILGRELERVFKGPDTGLSALPAIRANWTRVGALALETRFHKGDDPGRLAFTLHAEYSRGHKSVVSEAESDPNREGWTRIARNLIDRFAVDAMPLPPGSFQHQP